MKDAYQQFFGTRNTLTFALFIVAFLCTPLLTLTYPDAGYVFVSLISLFSGGILMLALVNRQRNSQFSVPSLAILPLRQEQ